jgi:hypothetical protein
MEKRSYLSKMAPYYPKADAKADAKAGKSVPMRSAVQYTEASNRILQTNLDELRTWMAFVARYPFRIPDSLKDDGDRRSYVSLVYTYSLFGELDFRPCDRTIKDPADGVVWLATTRNVRLLDKVFGMAEVAMPKAIKEPEDRIMQIGLVHELGHLAIRLNVDEITSIIPAEPYKVRLADTEVAVAYPLGLRLRCDQPTLLAFLHALEGAHGHVTAPAAAAAEEAVDVTKPLPAPPKPKAAAGDEPEDPGPAAGGAPGPAPAAHADGPPPQKLVITLVGSPSFLAPDAAQGGLKERFTLSRPDPANPTKVAFVANALATKVLDPGTPKLTPESILDWRTFCSRLRSQADDREPTVGKRLLQLLSPAANDAVKAISDGKNPTDALKADILASLNDVLASQRDLYRADAFARVAITNEADGLLKLDRKTLAPEKLAKLNRLLLQAAYPQQIARMAIRIEATVEQGSDTSPGADGAPPTRNIVRDGDLASTRFFLVRSLKTKSLPGAVTRDATGYISDLTPPHLEVELQVAALRFLEIQAAAKPVAEKRSTTTDPTILPRSY